MNTVLTIVTDIVGSPFRVPIRDEVAVDCIRCYGDGLTEGQLRASKETTFMVDTSKAGTSQLEVTIADESGECMLDYRHMYNNGVSLASVC